MTQHDPIPPFALVHPFSSLLAPKWRHSFPPTAVLINQIRVPQGPVHSLGPSKPHKNVRTKKENKTSKQTATGANSNPIASTLKQTAYCLGHFPFKCSPAVLFEPDDGGARNHLLSQCLVPCTAQGHLLC